MSVVAILKSVLWKCWIWLVKVLIADEPTGNLDPDNSWEIMNLLERINLQGTTVLMATHNSQIVNTLRHRVIAIENGRVVRDEAKGEYGYDE